MHYFRPLTLDEALARLAAPPRPRVVCGATDVYADAALVPARSAWVDISGIDALRGLARDEGRARIGAAVTWEAIAHTPWLPAALRAAAATVGSRQIRVQGTLGGNLCHASPVADGVPPLLALDAEVELASASGARRLPLADFLQGNRRTALQADELLAAVSFALPQAQDRTAFVKCTNREGSALAVVSAAVRLRLSHNHAVEIAAVAVGGASAVACRMPALEASLAGLGADELGAAVEAAPLDALQPIDDCRAPSDHRRHLARLAITRALEQCMEEAGHGAATA